MIAAIFGAFYIVEPISPLDWHIHLILERKHRQPRLPCSAVAQEVGVEAGSSEAEIVSTLGGWFCYYESLFTTLAAVAGAALLAIFPEPIAIAFKQYTVAAILVLSLASLPLSSLNCLCRNCYSHASAHCGCLLLGCLLTQTWVVIVASVFGTILVGIESSIKGTASLKIQQPHSIPLQFLTYYQH